MVGHGLPPQPTASLTGPPQEEKHGERAEEARVVKLYCQVPPIQKLDASLNNLKECECVGGAGREVLVSLERGAADAKHCRQLSLSTNCIDRLISLGGMKKLRILSLARNQLKRLEKLEDVAETLEELWVSYNQIVSLDGVARLTNLTTLYVSNNKVSDWSELNHLRGLEKLKDVLLVGNPIYAGLSREEARVRVVKYLPNVMKVDGEMVSPADREAAAALE